MCAYREKQQLAQQELDRVVGTARYPAFGDQEHLPYVSAVITEVLRWRSVFVLGGPSHAPIQDDIYNGFLIPKGAVVIGNIWAIHRNPTDFAEPDNFRPERFLNGLERPYPSKQGISAFGWGRRACSGHPLVEQGLALTIADILWAFDIRFGTEDKVSSFVYVLLEEDTLVM